MTPDEAMRLQQHLLDDTILELLPQYKEAIKLGIESLKRLIANRKKIKEKYQRHALLLPGETKE